MRRGQDFIEDSVHSCTGAWISMRPQCAHTQGHEFNAAPGHWEQKDALRMRDALP